MKKSILSFQVLPGIRFTWLTITALFPDDTYGQVNADSSSKPYSWLSTGIGVSTAGISFGAGYSVQSERSGLFTFRLMYNTELALFDTPARSTWDFGLMYGRVAKIKNGFASISGGFSLAGGVERGKRMPGEGWLDEKYEKLTFFTIGIPAEGQLFWAVSPSVGLGITLFANINPERSFYGALFCLRFGQLRQ